MQGTFHFKRKYYAKLTQEISAAFKSLPYGNPARLTQPRSLNFVRDLSFTSVNLQLSIPSFNFPL